jgi:hypothetical protein
MQSTKFGIKSEFDRWNLQACLRSSSLVASYVILTFLCNRLAAALMCPHPLLVRQLCLQYNVIYNFCVTGWLLHLCAPTHYIVRQRYLQVVMAIVRGDAPVYSYNWTFDSPLPNFHSSLQPKLAY